MKYFWSSFGLVIGGALVYGVVTNEAVRLLAVGLGGFLLAAVFIGGPMLYVNRQWLNSLGGSKMTNNYRVALQGLQQGQPQQYLPQADNLLPPMPQVVEMPQRQEDEVVA